MSSNIFSKNFLLFNFNCNFVANCIMKIHRNFLGNFLNKFLSRNWAKIHKGPSINYLHWFSITNSPTWPASKVQYLSNLYGLRNIWCNPMRMKQHFKLNLIVKFSLFSLDLNEKKSECKFFPVLKFMRQIKRNWGKTYLSSRSLVAIGKC